MTVHLVNPSHLSFGIGVITPRWMFVLAGATPSTFGSPQLTDETLEPFEALVEWTKASELDPKKAEQLCELTARYLEEVR